MEKERERLPETGDSRILDHRGKSEAGEDIQETGGRRTTKDDERS